MRRWALPDRIFFGHGACHILAGVYLCEPPLARFHAERIIPTQNRPGNHVFVTDGEVAFDYHGYSLRERLLAHHRRNCSRMHHGWDCHVEVVDFDLLATSEANARKMLGPDQYLGDPIPRAEAFVRRRDHAAAVAKVLSGGLAVRPASTPR